MQEAAVPQKRKEKKNQGNGNERLLRKPQKCHQTLPSNRKFYRQQQEVSITPPLLCTTFQSRPFYVWIGLTCQFASSLPSQKAACKKHTSSLKAMFGSHTSLSLDTSSVVFSTLWQGTGGPRCSSCLRGGNILLCTPILSSLGASADHDGGK